MSVSTESVVDTMGDDVERLSVRSSMFLGLKVVDRTIAANREDR